MYGGGKNKEAGTNRFPDDPPRLPTSLWLVEYDYALKVFDVSVVPAN